MGRNKIAEEEAILIRQDKKGKINQWNVSND